jgi:hypothetical protein
MIRTRNVKNGQWVRPVMDGYIHECCECGAMHRMDFRVQSDGVNIEMRGTRLTDQEAGAIRANSIPIEEPPPDPLHDAPDKWRSAR